jgi:hypothetical protein
MAYDVIKYFVLSALVLTGSISQCKAADSRGVIVAGLYEAGEHHYQFGNVELYNRHIQPQALLQLKNLESAERINEVKKTGECFATGACQKELTINIPLTVLDSYSQFLALSPQGDIFPITPVKIEARVLLVVDDDNALQASLSGGALITAEFAAVKNKGTGFVFIMPKDAGQMLVKSFSKKTEIELIVQATDKWLSIKNQQIPNKMHINSKKISKVLEISFEHQSAKYMALHWSAETPCADNFSIYKLNGKIEVLEWLGRGCDI